MYDTSAEALYFLLFNDHVWNRGTNLFECLWQFYINSKCMIIKLFVSETPNYLHVKYTGEEESLIFVRFLFHFSRFLLKEKAMYVVDLQTVTLHERSFRFWTVRVQLLWLCLLQSHEDHDISLILVSNAWLLYTKNHNCYVGFDRRKRFSQHPSTLLHKGRSSGLKDGLECRTGICIKSIARG